MLRSAKLSCRTFYNSRTVQSRPMQIFSKVSTVINLMSFFFGGSIIATNFECDNNDNNYEVQIISSQHDDPIRFIVNHNNPNTFNELSTALQYFIVIVQTVQQYHFHHKTGHGSLTLNSFKPDGSHGLRLTPPPPSSNSSQLPSSEDADLLALRSVFDELVQNCCENIFGVEVLAEVLFHSNSTCSDIIEMARQFRMQLGKIVGVAASEVRTIIRTRSENEDHYFDDQDFDNVECDEDVDFENDGDDQVCDSYSYNNHNNNTGSNNIYPKNPSVFDSAYLQLTFLDDTVAEKLFTWLDSFGRTLFGIAPVPGPFTRQFRFEYCYRDAKNPGAAYNTTFSRQHESTSSHQAPHNSAQRAGTTPSPLVVNYFGEPHLFSQHIREHFAKPFRMMFSLHIGALLVSPNPWSNDDVDDIDIDVEEPLEQIPFQPLAIDIDADDYDGCDTGNVKRCRARFCCQGKTVCEKCWQIVVGGCQMLELLVKYIGHFHPETIDQSLPPNRYRCFYTFSGRRGVHVFVRDILFCISMFRLRSLILDYISCRFLLQKIDSSSDHPYHTNAFLKLIPDEIIAVLEKYFEEIYCGDPNSPNCMFTNAAVAAEIGKLIRDVDEALFEGDDKSKGFKSLLTRTGCVDMEKYRDVAPDCCFGPQAGCCRWVAMRRYIMLSMLAPQFDERVTNPSHFIRAPLSLHGKTFNINMPLTFEELKTFNPLQPVVEFEGRQISCYAPSFVSEFSRDNSRAARFWENRFDTALSDRFYEDVPGFRRDVMEEQSDNDDVEGRE
jgi:DNA primase catalytic subunit